jgi:2-polyprenyl-6-methoxyphenol hydroxylase-like FAD-dependent oxidoreductase
MRVVIAGAGIGGLAAALSLHAAGIEADVFEAVAELRPLGVGINLLPHAVRELFELGFESELRALGIETERLVYANRFGQEIWSEPRGLGAGYNWPQFSVHRGRLQALLLDAVKARLGAARVHVNRTLVRIDWERDNPVAHFLSRDRAEMDVEADLIITADGIHSAARAQFYPDEGAPIWNRRVLWRGTTRAAPYLGGRTMVMAGHQNQKFVCYPIDEELRRKGECLINWIAELHIPGDAEWRREDWNREGRLADFLPRFADWRFPWLDVPAIIERAERVFEYPMVDRDPIPRWTFGNVTLLGDAAHPMYPIGSNGASQAIVDARTLAAELAKDREIAAALDRYEAVRRPPVSALVLANRKNGPEQVMQTAHERAPNGFSRIEDVMSRAELEAAASAYKQLAGFDREALNARASMTPRRR